MASMVSRIMTTPMMDTWNERIDDLKRKRMIRGERKHGPLNLQTDPRDFIQEGIEELIDFLNYLEMAMLQGKIPFCKWASIDRDIRFTIWRLTGEEG
jgi:hypothetical protein